MRSVLCHLVGQVPRFAAVGAAVAVILLGAPWWSIPAWIMALLGSGCWSLPSARPQQ